ncbi:MAG: hypothetical protein A4E49_02768 [Methanosaeta sp. PtaU1.Bin112]|jgi:hypothetical protein|nr:MAG: hypothetical protein A4E49_02768 [Methanosaeta sp. PtaU1.Bin112]
MRKQSSVKRKRIERFDFESVRTIRDRIDQDPKLKEALKKDFKGTLRAEGINVDKEFIEKVEKEWRSQISRDIRSKLSASPGKYPLLERVLEMKPIRVHVDVEKKGRNLKKKEVSV